MEMEALTHFGGSESVISRLNSLLRANIVLPGHEKMARFWREQVDTSWFSGTDIGYGQLKFLLRYFRFSPIDILGETKVPIDPQAWSQSMSSSPMVVIGTAGTGDSNLVGIKSADDYVRLRALSELEWLDKK